MGIDWGGTKQRFKQVLNRPSGGDRFKAAVAVMSPLLVQKGIYTQEEFEAYFCQWGEAASKEAKQ